jgi:hypothetical protein
MADKLDMADKVKQGSKEDMVHKNYQVRVQDNQYKQGKQDKLDK